MRTEQMCPKAVAPTGVDEPAPVGAWSPSRKSVGDEGVRRARLLRFCLPLTNFVARSDLRCDQGAGCWGSKSANTTGSTTSRAVTLSAHRAALACALAPLCCQ